MTGDSGTDMSAPDVDMESDSSTPDADMEVDIPEDMDPIVQISVGLEDLASCDDLCGAQGLVCTRVENFLGVMVAGTADYESDITSYSPDCETLPDVESSNADGQLVPLVTYTCNCTSGE